LEAIYFLVFAIYCCTVVPDERRPLA